MKKDENLLQALAFFGAIAITLALYLTGAPPFSLLQTQAEATNAVQAALPATEAPSPLAASGKQLVIVALDSFDQITKNTPQKKITLINPSDKSVTVHLFVQGVDICPKASPKNCVSFPNSVKVKPDKSQEVSIDFTKIALEGDNPTTGKLILVGGDVQKEIPFSVKDDIWQFWQQITTFRLSMVECIKAVFVIFVSNVVITVILGILIAYILYYILSLKVLPHFLPASLSMDVTDDNKALWAAYASRLAEINEQGYGRLDSPSSNEKIDLPTKLGKEGDIFRAVVELLNWILPRRGLSVRLQSIKSEKKGNGLSATLVRNDNGQITKGCLFWADDYGLSAKTGDNEYLLMTLVIFWLHAQMNKDKKQPPWESQACCAMANMIGSPDMDLAKKLYTEALSHDPTNRQALSGLGRIWLEASQKCKDHTKEDCLNFAILLLKEARKKSSVKDSVWFASTYNLAVAHIYREKPKRAIRLCKILLARINKLLLPPANGSEQPIRPTPENTENAAEFIKWLRKFKNMVLIFQQSVIVERDHPSTQPKLEYKIREAIRVLKSGMSEDGSTHPSVVGAGIANGGEHLNKQNPSQPQPLLSSAELLLVTLDYRSQYNAACYFSRCYQLASNFSNKNTYAETALDYLRLSLGCGKLLVDYARYDQALEPLRDDSSPFKSKFDGIVPPEKKQNDASVTHLVIDNPIEIKQVVGKTTK